VTQTPYEFLKSICNTAQAQFETIHKKPDSINTDEKNLQTYNGVKTSRISVKRNLTDELNKLPQNDINMANESNESKVTNEITMKVNENSVENKKMEVKDIDISGESIKKSITDNNYFLKNLFTNSKTNIRDSVDNVDNKVIDLGII